MLSQIYRAVRRVQTHNETHLSSSSPNHITSPVKRATTMDLLKERRTSPDSATSTVSHNSTGAVAADQPTTKKASAPFSFFLDTKPSYLDEEGVEMSYFSDDSEVAEADMDYWLEQLDSLEAREHEAETEGREQRGRSPRRGGW